MNNNYIIFYNNLVNLTRNKYLYQNFTSQDTYSDRLIIFLFHFAFFLKVFKESHSKEILQEVFDYIFYQIEANIREVGYGDSTVNKKMKNCINIFYSILNKIEKWDNLSNNMKFLIFADYLKIDNKTPFLSRYFDNYKKYLKKNTFNSLVKGVIKLKF